MSWLGFANHFLSNQRLHAWSWINRTFSWEWFVFCRKFGFECFWPFPFLFLFSVRWTSNRRTRFWLAIKGRGPLQVVVSLLFLFTWWQFCVVQILSGPKTFLHISSVFFQSLIGNFLSFFAFSQSLIGNFLLLLSSNLWSGTFFFAFFWGQGWAFSPWVKVYGELGFWLKACRTAGHDICQGVGLAGGSGIKEMSHIISMIYMQ